MFSYILEKFKNSFKPKSIPGLDGIRAISCLLVISGHFSYLYGPHLNKHLGNFLGTTFTFVFGNQYTGVTFFFVLSGFLITNILINEYQKLDRINLKNFFIKRVFRIFPAYFFYFFCMFFWIYQYQQVNVSEQDIWAIFTYTYNYFSDLNPWHFGHFWSLSVEEQFYLIWPILFLFYYKKLGTKMPWTIIIISPLIRVLTYYFFPEIRSRISILTHTRFDSLMFGCLLAYYYRSGIFDIFNKFILKFHLHIVSAFHIFFVSRILQILFKGKYVLVVGYSLDCFFMCVLIVYIIKNRTVVTNFFSSSLLVHLGNLSYSLYLWQMPFTWMQLGGNYIVPRIAGIYTCALFSYLFIETPFMSWREHYFKSKESRNLSN